MKRRLVILASHKELSDVSSKSRILGIPIHPWDTSLLHKYRSLYINIQFSHLTKTYQMCLTSLASLGYTTILGIRLFYINIGLFYINVQFSNPWDTHDQFSKVLYLKR